MGGGGSPAWNGEERRDCGMGQGNVFTAAACSAPKRQNNHHYVLRERAERHESGTVRRDCSGRYLKEQKVKNAEESSSR